MADPQARLPLTRQSVLDAHELIKPHIHQTPVLTNQTMDAMASTPQSVEALRGTVWEGMVPAKPKLRLWFKCENLQRVGAFKIRGAFCALLRLGEEREEREGKGKERDGKNEKGGWRERGVVTHSSGNHAQALALAARELGIPAHIVMPTISTPLKIAATKGYGAHVRFSGSTSTEREAMVEEVIKETGAILVPPYDHPDIIAGQGTMGLEMQGQVRRLLGERGGEGSEWKEGKEGKEGKGLDAIITPCGGGGMLSGVALACEGTGIEVFGAEPSYQDADDCRRGILAGKRIESVKSLTIADGLRTPVGKFPWEIIYERGLVKGVWSVGEREIRKAMKLVLERMKVLVEPSACVGLAVVLFDEGWRAMVEREAGERGWDVGVVFSGGNVGVEALGRLFEKEGEGDRA
ncbi:threonine dehydratase [Sclerotinia borealis F-4128]|uniref:Threonine dehydratase n=1 Tax=Sclerotinia borealis (strain F-4128) TaxID=1432307 RepID=W9CDB9_SCLBF|nr:threonine dehydratase [Sclerotinia borealis F-4128]